MGVIQYSNSKRIDDCPILLAETPTIYEAIMASIQKKLSHVIIESDSQITIRAILSATKAPCIIVNIVADIVVLASEVRNIKIFHL